MSLILSIFPGIGMLDMGFEKAGFCVVRGPDLIFGGDVRSFTPPAGKFTGIIGGPPCQDFSKARRCPPDGNGLAMLAEYVRIVETAQPDWWLLENVPGVPDVKIDGYSWQRLDVSPRDFGGTQVRNRHIQFGALDGGRLLLTRCGSVTRYCAAPELSRAVTTRDVRAINDIVRLQGLPDGFDIPAFSRVAMRRAVGNGVHVGVAYALAQAVADRSRNRGLRQCGCGCGRPVTGRQVTAGSACRKRIFDRRKKATNPCRAVPGSLKEHEK
jgi:DNA (cytosine-5)-methyltransferase 1